MGYKLLGFLVWQGAKFYLRGRMGGVWPKLAVVGVSAVVVAGAAGAIAASRHQSDE
jgi:hypothetical protein